MWCYIHVKKPIRVKAELHIRQSCKMEILTEFLLEWMPEHSTHQPCFSADGLDLTSSGKNPSIFFNYTTPG